VGLITFSDAIGSYIPPRSVHSQLTEILKVLSSTVPDGKTVTGEILHTLAERLHVRSLVVIVSDLLTDPEEFVRGLKHFRHNGHEVIVFHVLDNIEISFNYNHEACFIDLETGEKITAPPWHLREKYVSLFKERMDLISRSLHEISVDYSRLTTDMPFDRAITEYLLKRKRLY
jgi:uncharacterized protein (DUF58 family)